MTRSPSFFIYQPNARSGRAKQSTTRGVSEFLQANDKMASLLPAVSRAAALQKDCASVLPGMFEVCAVLQCESGQLLLSVPNTGIAAKLKQQLPKLQEALVKRGWQVDSIRIKVQFSRMTDKPHSRDKALKLPAQALSSLAALNAALDDSPRNQQLKDAIDAMVRRHRAAK